MHTSSSLQQHQTHQRLPGTAARVLLTLLMPAAFLPSSLTAATRFEHALGTNAWALLSLPFHADHATIRQAFSDDLPVEDYARTWVTYTYNPQTSEYENPGLDGPLQPGTGFWMIQNTPRRVVIDVAATDLALTSGRPSADCQYSTCAELSIPPASYSLVGLPFPSATAVAELSSRPCADARPCLLDAANTAFHPELFSYDSAVRAYAPLSGSDRLTPMQGAWIKARAATSPTLLIPDTDQAGDCSIAYERLQPESVDPQPHVTVASSAEQDIVRAVNTIVAAGGGTLHFPRGTYVIDRQFGARTHLYFENMRELKITGAGKDQTTLVLAKNPAFRERAVKTIVVDGYEKLEISDLQIRGQRAWMNPESLPEIGEERWAKANPHTEAARLYEEAEHQSGIFLRSGNRDSSASTYIHDVVFRHLGGDAINLANVDNAVFSVLDIDDTGRNGITIGGVLGAERSRNILIADNRFGPGIDTQLIDIELHGPLRDSPDGYVLGNLNVNVQVVGNQAQRQSPRDTVDLDQYFMDIHGTDGVILDANQLGNNRLAGSYSRNVRIQNNQDVGGGRFFRTFDAIMVGNSFKLVPQTCTHCTAHNAGFTFTETNAENLDAISLYGNVITSNGVAFPIRTHNARQVNVVSNRFIVDDTGKDSMMLVEADRTDVALNVADNTGLDNVIQQDEKGLAITRTAVHQCRFEQGR